MTESERIKLFKNWLASRLHRAEFELSLAGENQPESWDTIQSLTEIRDAYKEVYDTMIAMLEHN